MLQKFKNQVLEQESRLADQRRKIQQRLLAFDDKLQLKQTLKRKIRPLSLHASDIPMKVFLTIINIDNTILPVLLQLCKGFRKHLLFALNEHFRPAIERF